MLSIIFKHIILEINYIDTNQLNARYLLIEGNILSNMKYIEIMIFYLAVQRTNLSTFWNTIWTHHVSSIVMIYEINENVFTIKFYDNLEFVFLLIEFLIQYWPDENNPSIKIDENYQINFIRIIKRLDFDTSEFKIQKVNNKK